MMIKSMLPQCGSPRLELPRMLLPHSCPGAARGNWATVLTCSSSSSSLSSSVSSDDVCRHEASVPCQQQRVWMLQMSFTAPPLSLSLTPHSPSLSVSLRGWQFQVSCPFAVQRARICCRCRFNLRLCNLPQQQGTLPGHCSADRGATLNCFARCQGATVFSQRERERETARER